MVAKRWPLLVLAVVVVFKPCISRGQIESSDAGVIPATLDSLFADEDFSEERFLLPFVEEKVDYALGVVEVSPRCAITWASGDGPPTTQ